MELFFLRNLRRNEFRRIQCQETWSARLLPSQGVRPRGRPYQRKYHYLGEHGSPESHDEYARLISQWRAGIISDESLRPERVASAAFDLTITDLMLLYKTPVEGYYVKNGKPTKELGEMKYALRPVRYLYGDTLIREFGPLKLKSVRQATIDSDLSRGVINNRVNRIKRFFKWAVSDELAPPSVTEGFVQ